MATASLASLPPQQQPTSYAVPPQQTQPQSLDAYARHQPQVAAGQGQLSQVREKTILSVAHSV